MTSYRRIRGSPNILTASTQLDKDSNAMRSVMRATEGQRGDQNRPPFQTSLRSSIGKDANVTGNGQSAVRPLSLNVPPNSASNITHAIPGSSSSGEDTRKENYVSQHFRYNRFQGDLSQSIELTLRDYNICACRLRLSASQRQTTSLTFWMDQHALSSSIMPMII